jgi:FAD/FMN-containing dehydrogenase/Fe-S oxidoreductase
MSNAKSIHIHTDSQTRRLYANDASMYEELPRGVFFPQSKSDVRALVRQANKEQFSITARSGGTSLAGQTTGGGVIMDVSRYMTSVLELDEANQFAHLQPGVIRDTLNREAGKHGLLFGPDTATTNRCMLGGMIGNNSCGSFSIKHKTTREHILEIETVLSDGSTATFKPLSPEELEQKKKLDNLEGHIYRGICNLIEKHRDEILEAYPHPEIIRRNTGYALDKLCEMQPFGPPAGGRPFNLAELLCGSEGTLAMTASAKVGLVPRDKHRLVMAPHFDSIHTAMEATVEAVKHDPAAVELVDDIILNATKDNIEQRKNRFFLQGEPKCILIIQFEGDDAEVLRRKANVFKKQLSDKNFTDTAPVIADEEKMDGVWNLRKAGLGLLMGLGSDQRTPSFCEDTAVRVQDLPEYVAAFQKLMDTYDTDCVFYAHASVGELHLRPVIDISKPEGREKMKAMGDDIADLVHRFNGSLSGEHGDGRARAPYIEKVLGPEMMPLLQQVKEIWDPNYIFNPGKITGAKPIDEDLRISSFSLSDLEIDSQFNWRKEGSFPKALDLCNGAGVCRKLAKSGGTMCPSYMATKNEKDSTRGRANLFRQLFAGKGPEAFESEALKNALDLCLSCKACKSECPANVDMARMKAEFMQGWHDANGITLGERFFGQAASLYPLASLFPALSNWVIQTPVGKELLFQALGISKKRSLPRFAPQTFRDWFEHRTRPTSNPDGERASAISNSGSGQVSTKSKPNAGRVGTEQKVALLIDPFTNYHDPEIGKSAVQVLEALGYHVRLAPVSETGRPQLSKGMVKQAKNLAANNIPELHAFVKRGIPIVGLEPSEILTLRDEYLDLCENEMLQKAQAVAENSFQFEEFFVRALSHHPEKKALFTGSKETVQLHGHCHAKALVGNGPALEALSLAGYQTIAMKTGCCGMAGSFGYEADHYKVSQDIGELVLFPAVREMSNDALVCAPGFSCRHQIADGTGVQSYHPARLIANALR